MSKTEIGQGGLRRRPLVSREFIELNRRRRFATAAAEIAHEFGLGAITVSALVQLTGTARKSFYEVFANRADCLRFAITDAHERLFEPVRAAAGEGEWARRIEVGIAGFYGAVAADPLAAEMFLVHSFGAEPWPGDVGFESGAEELERLLRGGRAARGGLPAPELAEEYLARVILAVATQATRREEARALPGLAPEVTLLVSTVYLGTEGAPEALGPIAVEA